MKPTLNRINTLFKNEEKNGDSSYWAVVKELITDEDDEVVGYKISLGDDDNLIEARKCAGAKVGDTVIATLMSNGSVSVTSRQDGDEDAKMAKQVAELAENVAELAQELANTAQESADEAQVTATNAIVVAGEASDDASTAISVAEGAGATASNYITSISSGYGIQVHPQYNSSKQYTSIDSYGFHVFYNEVEKVEMGLSGIAMNPTLEADDITVYASDFMEVVDEGYMALLPYREGGIYHEMDNEDYWTISAGSSGGGVYDTSGSTFAPSSDNDLNLGTSNRRWKKAYLVDTSHSSDRRLKKNIESLDDKYVDFFDKLDPVSYNRKGDDKNEIHLGFIAQDVEQALKDAGLDEKNHTIVDDGESDTEPGIERPTYGLSYNDFIPVLVKKIKQLESRIEELEEEKNGSN